MRKFHVFILSFFFALLACEAQADEDIRAAALLIGADNAAKQSQSLSDLSASAQAGATGAVSASTVAGSGLNTALWLPGRKGAVLQLALNRALGQRGFRFPGAAQGPVHGPRAMPTAFNCNGAPSNDCSMGGTSTQYMLNGSEACSLGGTVQAVNVPVFLNSKSGLRVYAVDGGVFNYMDCKLLNVDMNNFPDFAPQNLNGGTSMSGEMISSIAETPSTFAGFFFSDMQMVSTAGNNFNVNGTSVVMDLYTSSTMSFNMLFDPATQQPINGIVSGTLYLFGTVQGESVDLELSFVENLAE